MDATGQKSGTCYSIKTPEAFASVMDRSSRVAGCHTSQELCLYLGCSGEDMEVARRRLSLPGAWFLVAFLKSSANPAWILHGEGEMLR